MESKNPLSRATDTHRHSYTHTHTSPSPTTRKLPGGRTAALKDMLLFGHSVVSDSLRPHGLQHARLPCPSPAPGWLLKLMSIESVMPSSHLILCGPLLLLPSIFPSIRVFSNESALHIRWPKYWSFSFSGLLPGLGCGNCFSKTVLGSQW